ncbi:MAG: M20/M25/M40 family metallo-hydrolase, partial [Candidatus Hermodarchaeota archaeon]|nr:M20/M25/M40 family metallo-hydrolase [Candidatus Hermodarchaeota archaeon]
MSRTALFASFMLVVLVCGLVPFLPLPSSVVTGNRIHSRSTSLESILPDHSTNTPDYDFFHSSFTSTSPVLNPPTDIEDIINQITTSTYNSQLTHLAGTIGPRMWGTVANDFAVDYIADEFQSYGLDVEFHSFSSNQPNVIGTLRGGSIHNNATIIVGAHLDTIPVASPGADDNGSGVSAVLEIARVLSAYQFNYTIMFVAFNAEEIGLVGSTAFANKLVEENVTVAVMYNFDMIIWDTPAAPENWKMHIVHNGGDSAWFAQHAEDLGQNLVGAPVQANEQGGWVSSDHAPFWNRGIPALWFFEYNGWGNPWIHSSQDYLGQPEYSPALGALTTKTVAAAVADFATIVSTRVGFPTIDFLEPIANSFVMPDNQVEVVLSIDDALDDVLSLEIAINDGPWINATSGLNSTHCTFPIDASGLYGSTELKARAIDAEGWIAETSTSVVFDKGIFCNIDAPHNNDFLDEGVDYRIWVNVTDPDNRNINTVS